MRRLVLLTLVHALSLAFALGAPAAVAVSHADLALDLNGSVDVYRTSAAGSTEEWLGEVTLEALSGPRPFVFTVSRNLQGNLAIATFTRGSSAYRGTSELSAPVPITP